MNKKSHPIAWRPRSIPTSSQEPSRCHAKLRYRVDLKGFMAECETNYFRLRKLFPLLVAGRELHIAISPQESCQIVLAVLETTPFTALVGIGQKDSGGSSWLAAPTMRVRIYHDAKLAEVVACDGSRVLPRNNYPNEHMFQPDEKAQWNRFLGELLAACIGRGYGVAKEQETRVGEVSAATPFPAAR